MTNSNKYGIWFLIVLCIVGVAACTQDRQPCLTPKIASLNLHTVRVASHTDSTAVDTALPSAVFVALTATGGKGTIYPAQSAFTLSLSPVTDTCMWTFATDTTAGSSFDTLTFRYSRNLQFISNACGFAYFYTMTNVLITHHFIDSLRVTNVNVSNNVNTNHLQVYVHPNF